MPVLCVIDSRNRSVKKTISIADADCTQDKVLTAIKNKLRFKPEGLFSLGGEPVDWRRALALGQVVVTRKGEGFVGAVRPVDVVDPGVTEVAVVGAHLVSPEAVDQLRVAAAMPYVRVAAGMPDLHVGIPVPIGTAIAVEDHVYPAIIGADIGCGVRLQALRVRARGQGEKLARALQGYASYLGTREVCPPDVDPDTALLDGVVNVRDHYKTLGSIGGGNHFAELQEVHEIRDPVRAASLGLSTEGLYLLVHSGSRSLGSAIQDAVGTVCLSVPRPGDTAPVAPSPAATAATATAATATAATATAAAGAGAGAGAGASAAGDVGAAGTGVDTGAEGGEALASGAAGGAGSGAGPAARAPVTGAAYLHAHDTAVRWARWNRALIARHVCRHIQARPGFLGRGSGAASGVGGKDPEVGEEGVVEEGPEAAPLDVEPEGGAVAAGGGEEEEGVILDVPHNFVCPCCFPGREAGDGSPLWLHRKGAIPSNAGPVVIPGSRGAFSYVVEDAQGADVARGSTCYSLPHGAGRTMTRSDALKRFDPKTMSRTKLGSFVVCDSPQLLAEEAPECYKDVDAIIATLQEAYGVNVIAVMKPVVTIKQ